MNQSMPGKKMARCRHRANFIIPIVTLGLTLLGSMRSIGAPQSIEQEFKTPSSLPKDVFDEPFFDPERSGDTLNLPAAKKKLEDLTDKDLKAAQRLFDVFAWRAFVALNGPADADGSPSKKDQFYTNQTAPRIWEFWKQTSEIYLPNGAEPSWEGPGKTAGMKLDHWKAGWRQHTTLDQGKQAFSGPLIDQNGNWLHYQALVNRTEFNYLVSGTLYNLEGQAEFQKRHVIEFPINDDKNYGSIELKLAWKVLTDKDDESRYLVREIPIVRYHPAGTAGPEAASEGQKTGKATPGTEEEKPTKVGLVGMHISMRTASSPQWIWATFEQIDNTRVNPDTVHGEQKDKLQPSLSNPDDPEALVRANLLPAMNAKPDPATGQFTDWDESIPMAPVEVLRLVPPPTGTERVNREVQAFLGKKNSPLRYYELIGTQWPKHPLAPAVPGGQGSAPESIVRKMPGEMTPVYLVNSTMETYFQKGFQDAGPLEQDDRVPFSIDTTKVFGTESCVGCHYSAGACIGFRKDSKGQFLRDASGKKIPIFGENSNGGSTGNANFSWALQIEAQSSEKLDSTAKPDSKH